MNLAREQEAMRQDKEDAEALEKAAKDHKLLEKREMAMLRQRKLRNKQKESEIIAGTRNPDGTKCKIVQVNLTDSALAKRPRIAEETRPGWLIKKTITEKNRKAQGRTRKKTPRQATYHNWFSLVCWMIIEEAAKAAGWRMSATQIVKIAKARSPTVFEHLSRETVRDWIDQSGPRPCWSDATLLRVKAGNLPGHSKGGPPEILVSPDDQSQVEKRTEFIISRRTTHTSRTKSRID